MGGPVQGSMVVYPEDYVSEDLVVPRQGVILEIRYPDDPRNRSAMEHQDYRGYLAEATVRPVGVDMPDLTQVLVPPSDSACGLDGFEEWYPRGSSKLVTGENFDPSMSNIDPYDLDGDWCILQFINGDIQNPYIARWWPNPRNLYDTLTSGQAYPPQNASGGTALDQRGRYFRRINGVEQVITRTGDVWFSTYRAGSMLNPGGEPDNGRFSRMRKDEGGGIRVQLNPSKTMEMTWNEQVDGLGVNDIPDESLPQNNPQPTPPAAGERDKTYLRIDNEKFELEVPLTLEVRSSDKITLKATTKVDIETEDINLLGKTHIGSADGTEAVVLGNVLKDWLFNHTHPTGTGPSGMPLEGIDLDSILSTKHTVDE